MVIASIVLFPNIFNLNQDSISDDVDIRDLLSQITFGMPDHALLKWQDKLAGSMDV